MKTMLRALNRWTILAALVVGTLLGIHVRLAQITLAGHVVPMLAAAYSRTVVVAHAPHRGT